MSWRYEISGQAQIWSDDAKYRRWAAVELDAMRHNPEVPQSAYLDARLYDVPIPSAVGLWEDRVGHDVVAFLRAWTERMPVETARWVHHGLTSSDVVDTALSRTLVDSTLLILDAAYRHTPHNVSPPPGLVETLRRRALDERNTPRVGRTHGRVAAPTTVGLQLAGLGLLVKRAVARVRRAMDEVNVVKLSGPVGAYSEIHPSVEDAVAATSGQCTPAVGSTQVMARDGIANWGAALASLATACEQVATWVRLGAQSGVDELAEGRTNEQVGSSSMPHKRNPIRSERICGLARVVRGHAATLANDVVLWSERDISHSSVERELLSSVANLTHYLVYETTQLVSDLAVIHRNIGVNLACYSMALTSHRDLTRRVRRGSSYWAAHEDVSNPANGPGEVPGTTAGWLDLIGNVDHVYSALEGD